MANKEKLERIRRNTNAALGIDDPDEPTAEQTASDDGRLDLDDQEVQQNILNPSGTLVELSYGDIRLYPPTMMERRRIYGFCTGVLAMASRTQGGDTPEAFFVEIVSILNRRPDIELELMTHAAFLLERPGRVTDAQVKQYVREFQNSCEPNDLSILYKHLAEASGISKKVGAPNSKNLPLSRTARRRRTSVSRKSSLP